MTKMDDFSRVFTTKLYLLHASPPQARKFWCFPLFYWKNLRFSSDFANIFSEIFSICNSRFSRIGKILKILPILSEKNTGSLRLPVIHSYCSRRRGLFILQAKDTQEIPSVSEFRSSLSAFAATRTD